MSKKMPELFLDEFEVCEFLEDDLDMEIFVEPTIKHSNIVCPSCGSPLTISNGNEERFFRDLNIYDKRVGIVVQGKRYLCQNKTCAKKSFVLNYSCIEPSGKMSNRLKHTVQEKSLHRTFTSVAEEYGLSAKTVENAFDDFAEVLDRRPAVIAPSVLGIDECHLGKVMRPVYVDVENSLIIEMGRSIKKIDVVRDLKQFQNLENVKVVTTDMCMGYRGAIAEVFPNAIHVIDKFHVIQHLIDAVEEARKCIYDEVMAEIDSIPEIKNREYIRKKFLDLRPYHYLFKKNIDNLSDERLSQLVTLCEDYPRFAQLLSLKEGFRSIYGCPTLSSALHTYDKWEQSIPDDDAYAQLRKFAKTTISNWKEPIFNYFIVDGRKTNAVTERLNGAIKSMQNMGRGYSYKVLRAKMLFGSTTSKKPMYARITQKRKDINYGINFKNYSYFKTYLREDLFEKPSWQAGTLESHYYYDTCNSDLSDNEQAHEDSLFREMHLNDKDYNSKCDGFDEKLIKNGGANIDNIIRYYKEHGECI